YSVKVRIYADAPCLRPIARTWRILLRSRSRSAQNSEGVLSDRMDAGEWTSPRPDPDDNSDRRRILMVGYRRRGDPLRWLRLRRFQQQQQRSAIELRYRLGCRRRRFFVD